MLSKGQRNKPVKIGDCGTVEKVEIALSLCSLQ